MGNRGEEQESKVSSVYFAGGRGDRKGGSWNTVVFPAGSGWGGKLEQICSLEALPC